MQKQPLSNKQITSLDSGFEKIIERSARTGTSPADLAKTLSEAVILTHNEGIDAALKYLAAAEEEWAAAGHRIS